MSRSSRSRRLVAMRLFDATIDTRLWHPPCKPFGLESNHAHDCPHRPRRSHFRLQQVHGPQLRRRGLPERHGLRARARRRRLRQRHGRRSGRVGRRGGLRRTDARSDRRLRVHREPRPQHGHPHRRAHQGRAHHPRGQRSTDRADQPRLQHRCRVQPRRRHRHRARCRLDGGRHGTRASTHEPHGDVTGRRLGAAVARRRRRAPGRPAHQRHRVVQRGEPGGPHHQHALPDGGGLLPARRRVHPERLPGRGGGRRLARPHRSHRRGALAQPGTRQRGPHHPARRRGGAALPRRRRGHGPPVRRHQPGRGRPADRTGPVHAHRRQPDGPRPVTRWPVRGGGEPRVAPAVPLRPRPSVRRPDRARPAHRRQPGLAPVLSRRQQGHPVHHRLPGGPVRHLGPRDGPDRPAFAAQARSRHGRHPHRRDPDGHPHPAGRPVHPGRSVRWRVGPVAHRSGRLPPEHPAPAVRGARLRQRALWRARLPHLRRRAPPHPARLRDPHRDRHPPAQRPGVGRRDAGPRPDRWHGAACLGQPAAPARSHLLLRRRR